MKVTTPPSVCPWWRHLTRAVHDYVNRGVKDFLRESAAGGDAAPTDRRLLVRWIAEAVYSPRYFTVGQDRVYCGRFSRGPYVAGPRVQYSPSYSTRAAATHFPDHANPGHPALVVVHGGGARDVSPANCNAGALAETRCCHSAAKKATITRRNGAQA